MTAIDRTGAIAAFRTYTDAYDAANPRIALKIEHTYHVAEACDAVARKQDWAPQDIDLAWLCGLLHDMGRFEQLRRWDTFKDAESMSHAKLGLEVLFGKNPADAPAATSIRDFIDSPAEDELIRASIAYHSDFRLPAQLDERTRCFCDIVRDGDKIDIMRTIADSTVDTILKVDEDAFLASHFSAPTLAAFDEHRCVARDERDEPADYLVGLICFMFELVYPASRALAREQGDIYRLLDSPFGITQPFTDPATQATWSRLKEEMRDWLARA
ncbi:MAG: HD domain-containing protein [Collinsella sp.]|nr:HD domain-containing protein [Collinsella sp.]MDY3259130.1 HD domain-containing protein [Collinsella sp.]MDY5081197.1 HD domain-containing protein [Collinsella sp.]MDY5560538.1 HD domain-containing protein [Collinsella sp.]